MKISISLPPKVVKWLTATKGKHPSRSAFARRIIEGIYEIDTKPKENAKANRK